MIRSTVVAVTLAAAAFSLPVVAHHSFAMFDQTKTVTLTGTVTAFQWTNPHSFIEIDVPKGGATEHWSIELNSPNNLTRQGWKRSSVKPGDKVTITLNPLRDGTNFGSRVGAIAKCPMKDGKPVPPAAGKHCDSVPGSEILGGTAF